eukprot:TRINITY_DN9781_c0_g1_i4.p1 TRINITY_DN9781_c0_g1~~TRINITY_DN9781_c0_g1_i4.p1  ORF type:complete len:534 (+),score=37.15 TRINITY_DN9781_c0_g1_i4:70-1671(+)
MSDPHPAQCDTEPAKQSAGRQRQRGRKNRGQKPGENQEEPEEEGEICIVCSEVRGWWGVWVPCGHGVCWRCALRIRYMSPDDVKSQWCCICQTESSGVCIKGANTPEGIENRDEKYLKDDRGWQVWYETADMKQDVEYLRGWYCHLWEDCGTETPFKGFQALQDHLWKEHKQGLCEPCTKGNTKFPSEQTLYTRDQLRIHEKPGGRCHKDSHAFPGHPLCFFCSKLLYDNDALYLHMREQHVLCDLCEGNPDGEKLVFYRNHKALFAHMDHKHVKCKTCERNYYELRRRGLGAERHPTEWTFLTELELQKHNLNEHGGSKEAVGNAARNLLSFSYSNRAGHDDAGLPRGESLGPGEQIPVITFDMGSGKRRTIKLAALPHARENRRRDDDTLIMVLKDVGAGEAAIQNAAAFLSGDLRVVEYYGILQTCVGDVGKVIGSIVKAIPSAEKREALRLAHNMATDTEREKGETMRNFAKAVNSTADFPTLREPDAVAPKPVRSAKVAAPPPARLGQRFPSHQYPTHATTFYLSFNR